MSLSSLMNPVCSLLKFAVTEICESSVSTAKLKCSPKEAQGKGSTAKIELELESNRIQGENLSHLEEVFKPQYWSLIPYCH